MYATCGEIVNQKDLKLLICFTWNACPMDWAMNWAWIKKQVLGGKKVKVGLLKLLLSKTNVFQITSLQTWDWGLV